MFMLRKEILEAKKVEKQVTYVDRLINNNIRYLAVDRKENFEDFGMTSEMIRYATKQLKLYEKQEARVIRMLQEVAQESPEIIQKAFCNSQQDYRSRYYAIQFLIEKKDSETPTLINLKKISRLEIQPWTTALPIDEMYRTLELREDPRQDSTIMYVASVFGGQQDLLLNRDAPYGDGDNWSWKEVLRKDRAIDRKVASYIAMMHLFTEKASDRNNEICFDSESKP